MNHFESPADGLKQRVEARDRLVLQAENAGQKLLQQALSALSNGDLPGAESAVHSHDADLQALVENLRIYQAELRAQADELAASHARTEVLVTRFSSLFSNMPVAALLVSGSGQVIEHNVAATELFGLRLRSTSPRFMHRLVDSADYQHRVWPAFSNAEKTVIERVGFIAESGRRFQGELQVAMLPAAQPRSAQFVCAVIDRSEQIALLRATEQAADSLRVNEAFQAETARIARIAGWEWQREGRSLRWSAGFRALFALPEDTPASLDATLALCSEAARPVFARALARADEGQPFEVEIDMHSASGQALRVLAVGHADPDGTGRTRHPRLVGYFQDITQQARTTAAMNAAEAASRAKSAFLSRMSHELRTPLNAVLGFAQLMRMEAEAGDLIVKPHRVALIETAARHLLDLINEVLDVSSIESGQMTVRLARFDPHALLLECLPLVQGLADTSHVTLVDRAFGKNPMWAQGDRLRMKEVLINLLSNAVKYNRSEGTVAVDMVEQGDRICITVSDTGRGLDEAQLANLFQPFNRLGAEASGIEGSGMGLYVSRRFVELMGGSIAVDSRVGEGTRFSVHLPRE